MVPLALAVNVAERRCGSPRASSATSCRTSNWGDFWTVRNRSCSLDTSAQAIASRTAAVESDLRVMGDEIEELRTLAKNGVRLNQDSRADAILDRMAARNKAGNTEYTFWFRALASPSGVYSWVTAHTVYANTRIPSGKVVGKAGQRRVKAFWMDNIEKPLRAVTNSKWKHMTARSKLAGQVWEAFWRRFAQRRIDAVVRKDLQDLIREKLDEAWQAAFADVRRTDNPIRPAELRTMVAARPAVLTPLTGVPLTPIAQRALAPLAQAAPRGQLARPVDPVVQTIVNEDAVHSSYQAIESSSSAPEYEVETRYETTNIPPVDVSKYLNQSWNGDGRNLLQ